MKFENGCWIFKEEYTCFPATEAYYVTVTEKEVKIMSTTYHVNGRGDTLGGVNLSLSITSPARDIIRVTSIHHAGVAKKYPEFELALTEPIPLDVKNEDDLVIIQSGDTTLEITKKNFSMTYKYKGKSLTTSKGKDYALIKKNFRGLAYDMKGDTADTYMRQQLSVGVGEHIYGLGEHFTPLVRNGQTINTENKDGGTSTDQAYKNIPFYLSSKNYGVFVAHPDPFDFEICSDNVTKCEFAVEGGYLDYYVMASGSMKEVLSLYTDLTGKPSLPAPWSFGLWLTTSFTTNYDEQTVLSFIDGMHQRGIPLRAFHFDPYYMKGFHWMDFTWDSDVFPDPRHTLEEIHKRGVNVCIWINPYIAQESPLFEEGKERGFFIRRTNGDVWQWDMWQPGMAIVDFTNPDARKWYSSFLEKMMDLGVDCFKTDFGERIPKEDVIYFDGSDPKRMRDYYTYLYNKTVYETIENRRGKGEAVLFSRSAIPGSQKYPIHWGGDCWSDYESMEESLRGGLSLLMSGFGYWAHDIGGFESTSTADVYKRWVAFGLFSSHSRLHGSSSYRVPWLYDEEAVDVVKFFTRLKASLMPYIYSQAIQTSRTGIPMLRAMALEFQDDRTCDYLDKQYMFGDNLLVAPIFNEEGVAEYYLPAGSWTNFFTGEKTEGGKWYKHSCNYMEVPLFVKENSVIAIGNNDNGPEYDYADGVTLNVYGLQEGCSASCTIYNMDGSVALTAKFTKKDGLIAEESSATKPYTVKYYN